MAPVAVTRVSMEVASSAIASRAEAVALSPSRWAGRAERVALEAGRGGGRRAKIRRQGVHRPATQGNIYPEIGLILGAFVLGRTFSGGRGFFSSHSFATQP
jgi:hypothetical protein